MQKEERIFYLNTEEAEAVARADTGAGDLPRQLSTGMVVIMIFIILIRMILYMPFPSFRTLGAYAVALVAWILMIWYVKHRVRITRDELKGKPYFLRISETEIAAGKYEDNLSFRTTWNEIGKVEMGRWIYRITSPMGRLCLPKSALSAQERDRLESLPAGITEVNWM